MAVRTSRLWSTKLMLTSSVRPAGHEPCQAGYAGESVPIELLTEFASCSPFQPNRACAHRYESEQGPVPERPEA